MLLADGTHSQMHHVTNKPFLKTLNHYILSDGELTSLLHANE